MRLCGSFIAQQGEGMGQYPVSDCGNNHGPPTTATYTYVPSRQRYLPQTSSALDDCLHKDDTEGGNLTICHQHLPRFPFSAFYYHNLCLAQMRHLAVRSSTTQEMRGNW